MMTSAAHMTTRSLALLIVGVLAGSVGLPARQPATGPTRIKIAAGTVTAEDSRVGLVGAWEPDADLGAAPGANQVMFFPDGVYLNPFRNVVAVSGIWDATAASLTMTPIEVRSLETGALVPEVREFFAQIAWERPDTRRMAWLTPDRYQEIGQFPWRRAAAARETAAVHEAFATGLLEGTWTDARGVEATFLPKGAYREQLSGALVAPRLLDAGKLVITVNGEYRLDVAAGVLRRVIRAVESTGPEVLPIVRDRILATGVAEGPLRPGERTPSTLRWTARNELTMNGERWQRRR
jgi:hypothetical protein